MTIPRLLIAGVSSHVGKTTVTVALARALTRRGLRVAMFKCGPDYLDPTYHRRAAGRASHNLDGWMMGRAAVVDTFREATRDADIALIEGVMGLFDGASASSLEGSSAQIATFLQAPVMLVVDAKGMARSVAALAHGFATFDPEVRVAGVFCNRVGSDKHLSLLREACVSPLVVGGMLAERSHSFSSRHLGLHDAEQTKDEDFDVWAERLCALTSVDDVLAMAASAEPLEATAPAPPPLRARCRIGIARDDAFSFYYPYNLQLLERLGATLVPFSPILDAALPAVDGVYIGGGYPELHARALADNRSMRASVRDFGERGGPVYAECGGLMYLSEAIVTLEQERYEMVGLVAGQAVMQSKLAAIGYVEVETQAETILGAAGTKFRGHQFRYSNFATSTPPSHYAVETRRGGKQVEGYGTGSVLASYVHAHWASNTEPAQNFVRACEAHAMLASGSI